MPTVGNVLRLAWLRPHPRNPTQICCPFLIEQVYGYHHSRTVACAVNCDPKSVHCPRKFLYQRFDNLDNCVCLQRLIFQALKSGTEGSVWPQGLLSDGHLRDDASQPLGEILENCP